MSKVREASNVVAWIRKCFSHGRDLRLHMRYEGDQAARTQPPPIEKPSVYHLLSNNDYHQRDARRQVERADSIYVAGQKQLTSGEDVAPEAQVSKLLTTPRPGLGQAY